jgi:hypothetical protein
MLTDRRENPKQPGLMHNPHMLPADYFASRERFHELARGLDIETRAFPQGHDDNGVPLTTDIAWLGPPDADTVIVIASGTHGVEGYAGAACQFRFLERWRESHGNSDHAAAGYGWLLVHAVNPWGYRHDSRVTRENVDLNRNFVEFPISTPDPGGYGKWHDILVTHFRPLPRGWWNEARLLSRGLTAARRRRLQEAITEGQYAYPDGLFYGGTGPATSRLVWEEIMQTYVTGRRRAVLLDIHTGLGKRGACELMTDLPASAHEVRLMNSWFEGAVTSLIGDDSVSAQVAGTLTAAFNRIAAEQRYPIGLEFGTCSPIAVLYALREDQWCRNHGAASPAERACAGKRMREAFACRDARWHDDVVGRFEQVLDQLQQGLMRSG